MISLGDETTGSNRISLGGGINSLGTTIGPLVVALLLFGSGTINDDLIQNLSLDKVILLYLGVGILFILIAGLFGFSKTLPSGKNNEETEKATKALASLVIITGLLIGCFAPVFSSYRSETAEIIKFKTEEIKRMEHFISNKKSIDVLENEIHELRIPLEKKKNGMANIRISRNCWRSSSFI